MDVRPHGRRAAAPRVALAGQAGRAAAHGALPRAGTTAGRLVAITANLYRDGNDSVAWHGDRIGRKHADTVVAILSLGSTRRFLLRPDGGGPSIRYELAPGDLIVLGGTCQKTWEHCVPKRAWAGPRISVMFRERGVR